MDQMAFKRAEAGKPSLVKISTQEANAELGDRLEMKVDQVRDIHSRPFSGGSMGK